MLRYVLVLAVCALALATPEVDSSNQLFPQNGGTLTWTGSGFTRSNPWTQFNFILVNDARTVYSNPLLRDPTGSNGNLWHGCIASTLVVNAAGTTASCTIEYIPDYFFDGATGATTLSLDVVNGNGQLAIDPVSPTDVDVGVQIAIIQNVVEQIRLGTNQIPSFINGITVDGEGFPAAGSILPFGAVNAVSVNGIALGTPYAAFVPAYFLTLDWGEIVDNNAIVIDILGGTNYGSGATPTANSFDNVPAPITPIFGVTANGDVTRTGAVPNIDEPVIAVTTSSTLNTGFASLTPGPVLNECECTWSSTRVDCGFCNPGFDVSLIGTPNHVLTATLYAASIADAAVMPAFDTVVAEIVAGPSQIATINDDAPIVPTVDSSEAIYNWNSQILTLTGSGFATYPSIQSNIVMYAGFVDGNPAVNPDGSNIPADAFKCIPFNVNADGTRLDCRMVNVAPSAGDATFMMDNDITIALVVGTSIAFSLDPVLGEVTTTVGSFADVDLTAPITQIDPRSFNTQRDSRFITITSGLGGFPVDYAGVQMIESNTVIGTPASADDFVSVSPSSVSTTVTLTGIEGGNVLCSSQFPNTPNPRTVSDGTLTGNIDTTGACQIVSMSPTEIRLRIPGINTDEGTSITAQVSTSFHGGTPVVIADAQVIGIVSDAAGVGGDPHFFGFLGEKYDFAGEAGKVYNLLTDEDVQLNAEIGKWHFGHGEETIIKSLALKTESHRLLIDAGGNHLGAASFSIDLDGQPLAPNATVSTNLGHDGFVRWHPIAEGETAHLPLWERHNGIAIVEITLNNYRFQILSVEEGRDSNGVWRKQPSRFLDFMCQMLDTDRRPHGLFGQSAHLAAGKRDVESWGIEGSDKDYEVSGSFADDFTFNKFDQ